MQDRVVSYAQNREDVILAAFFNDKPKGFYVDVGAHHHTDDSVTKYFYDRGWRGINFEPNKRLFDLLQEARPNDINLNIGIADKPGKLTLRVYDDGDGLSTFSSEMQNEYTDKKGGITKNFHDHTVTVATLADVFKEQKVTKIDFLKIDIEGYEYQAIIGNDWQKYRPEVLCIEANHVHNDWRPVVEKNGYVFVFFDGLNEYYATKESGHTPDNFPYVQGLIGRPIVSRQADDWLTKLQASKENLEILNKKLSNDLRQKEDEITRLNVYIYEHTKLRIVIRDVAKALNKSITVRLEDRSKKKKYYPVTKLSSSETKTAEQLYKTVRQLDEQAVHSKPGFAQSLSTAFFSTALVVYKFAKRALRKVLRQLKKVIKR